MTIENILKELKSLGACELVNDNISSLKELVELMFSPQGQEFCENTKCLNADKFSKLATDLELLGVFIDRVNVITSNHNVAFVRSSGKVVCKGVNAVYIVIIAHNSNVEIIATDYAVVKVVHIDGKCNVIKDSTARIL